MQDRGLRLSIQDSGFSFAVREPTLQELPLRPQRSLRSLQLGRGAREVLYRKRSAVRFVNACQFATSSSTESPPNFSISVSARTMATMASPTTAAAGTAQTSLRSTAAGLSVIVVRSTERSGFISVEIGFMYAVRRRSSPLVTPPSRPPALLVGRRTPI